MVMTSFFRLLRTASSERYVLQRSGADVGTIDLHFVQERRVVATLFVLGSLEWNDNDIEAVVQQIDEQLLPDLRRDESGFMLTVLRGEVLGTYTPASTTAD